MRLRLRKLVGLAIAVAPLLTSVSCCKLHVIGDVVSGAPKGAALVKVQVVLEDKGGTCVASVQPPRVVVYRGGAIRWRVDYKCANQADKRLTFTQPKPQSSAAVKEYGQPQPWSYRFCSPTIALNAGNDEKNVLLCEVPENVVPAVYKYNLDGAAKLDPDIEVRKGG